MKKFKFSNFALVAAVVCLALAALGCSHKSDSDKEAKEVAEETSTNDDVDGIKTENEVETALYQIYFPGDSDMEGRSEYDGTPYYSSNFKNRIKELGISQSDNAGPYTKSFSNLLDKVSDMEQKSGAFILDCNILWESQEEPVNFDIQIQNIKVIDEDNAEVTTTFINGECKKKRIFVMKRENGIFKIDDFIDEDESTRKWLNDEIKSTEEYIREQSLSQGQATD